MSILAIEDAFGVGLADGRNGNASLCPFRDPELAAAWRLGANADHLATSPISPARAYGIGKGDRAAGSPKTANPFALPALAHAWAEGWEAGRRMMLRSVA